MPPQFFQHLAVRFLDLALELKHGVVAPFFFLAGEPVAQGIAAAAAALFEDQAHGDGAFQPARQRHFGRFFEVGRPVVEELTAAALAGGVFQDHLDVLPVVENSSS